MPTLSKEQLVEIEIEMADLAEENSNLVDLVDRMKLEIETLRAEVLRLRGRV